MADQTIKIRVESADLAAWRRVAGHRGLSQWLRGLANTEILRLNAVERAATPPARVLPSSEGPVTRFVTCRHGLVNCKVCGSGVFGVEQEDQGAEQV